MAIIKKRAKILLYGNLFGAYRSQNLIKYLLDSGYRVSFILPEFYYERGEKKDILTKVLRAILAGYYYIELFIKAALADIIYLLPLNSNRVQPVVWASRLFGTKLVVEMYISFYDSLVREKQEVDSDSPAARALQKSDAIALSEADYIVHLSRYELGYWAKLLGVALEEDKIWVAPLFCEPELTRLKSQATQDDCLRICWWGTCIPTHGLDNILAALQQLKAADIAFTCQLFGIPQKGREYLVETYKTQIKTLGLSDAVVLRQDLKFMDGSLPNYLIEHCDLALGLFGETEKAQAAVPNKLIEALVLRIPSLTIEAPALKEFFDPGVDFWTCQGTPEAIAQAITQIATHEAYPVDWEQTREKVLQTFSLRRYQQVIDELMTAATQSTSG